MNKINIGCGPDIKEGWTNTDNNSSGVWEGAEYWDITHPAPGKWHNQFDFALVSHTLCLLTYDEVDIALENIKQVLKDGGTLEVIDMDTMLAFSNMEKGVENGFVGFTGSWQERMCKHLVGFGRKSIYTTMTMSQKLLDHGFTDIKPWVNSEHNFRVEESLVVQGTK